MGMVSIPKLSRTIKWTASFPLVVHLPLIYPSRRLRVWLGRQRHTVNRKRVQLLIRTMGLRTIYRRPRTSNPGPGHRVYPYLLGGMHPDTIGNLVGKSIDTGIVAWLRKAA